jgi:4,5-dihydroxyphthalate decarboxylase
VSEIAVSVGRYPHTAALLDGEVVLEDGVRLAVAPGGTAAAFRGMLDEQAFDVCEVPIVNYLRARELGVPVTGLPIFTTRRFPHGMLIWNTATGVRGPSDLEGRTVGIPYHGNTDVVWVRGLLETDHGVDVDAIDWLASLAEPLEPHAMPENVHTVVGAPLGEMLLASEIAGLVEGRGQTIFANDIAALAPDLAAAERAWHERTGIFPVLFTVVIADALLASRPSAAEEVFSAFVDAKADAYARRDTAVEPPSAEDLTAARVSGFPLDADVAAQRSYLGADPLAYGLEPNRLAIAELIRLAAAQRLIAGAPEPDDAFLPLEQTPDATPHAHKEQASHVADIG